MFAGTYYNKTSFFTSSRRWLAVMLVVAFLPVVAWSQESPTIVTGEVGSEGMVSQVGDVQTIGEKKKFSIFSLRTNLLYDAVLVPSFGVHVSLGSHWTVGFDYFGTWMFSKKLNRYWQTYGGYVTVRRYFTKNGNEGSSLFPRGHHVGVYALGMTYDFEWGGVGYQASKFGFGAGIEYGYSKRLAEGLHIDFSIGLGFQDGEYEKYEPRDNCYVWLSTHKRHWWGPTKAEISLIWVFGEKGAGK